MKKKTATAIDHTMTDYVLTYDLKKQLFYLTDHFPSGKVRHELRVQIHELRVQIHELED